MELPKSDKYTICFLNSEGKPTNYILFGGPSQPLSNDEFKNYNKSWNYNLILAHF
mgnify:CR=1 FL=1